MRHDKTILIVEDEADARNYFEMVVRCLGYSIGIAEDGEEALACLEANRGISLVLLDLLMPRRDGLETLREMRAAGRQQPVIMLSGEATTTNVVQAIKAGATDFLAKPISHEDLRIAIQRVLSDGTLAEVSPSEFASDVCLTESWMGKDLQAALRRVAAADVPLLIEGETGAGKEVLARQIHALSPRAGKPFLKLNCAALPSELVESELFGYERGAFTGAFTSKPGKFEMAQGGTILLDEIGDMDVRLQAKLLHVLQDKECERLGGKERVPLDVRVMAATHCDLLTAMEDGRFRADLYYRLNVVSLRVPPLRERKHEILAGAEFFMRKHRPDASPAALLSPALREAMLEYEWPGNLRELENMMRRLLVMQDAEELTQQLLSLRARRETNAAARLAAGEAPLPGAAGGGVIRFHTVGASGSSYPILERVDEAKRKAETDAILRALDASRWNRKQAAKILRIDYKALLYKMRKLEIEQTPPGQLRSAAGGA
ncbi:MAG TPA: sigma-54 dependent transcriptional regulator [Bryobacteraceae bacterium]|nr:sigma-54 dependent transcriptional regulator [Bryobacteraceae bacterium]